MQTHHHYTTTPLHRYTATPATIHSHSLPFTPISTHSHPFPPTYSHSPNRNSASTTAPFGAGQSARRRPCMDTACAAPGLCLTLVRTHVKTPPFFLSSLACPLPMPQPRRRNRNTFVCTFCKRRKVRCDKGNPCSTCVKYGNPVCEYSKDLFSAAHLPPVVESQEQYPLRPSVEPFRSASAASLEKPPFHSPPNKSSSTSSSMTASTGSSGGSSTTSASYGLPTPTASYAVPPYPQHPVPEVQSELHLLEKKILMLEKSVSLLRPADGTQPVWSTPPVLPTPDAEPFSFHRTFLPFAVFKGRLSRYVPPLLWIALIRSDNALRHLFSYNWKANFSRAEMFVLQLQQASEPSDRVFIDRFAHEVSITGTFDLNAKDKRAAVGIQKYYEKAKATGLTVFDGDLLTGLALDERYLQVLPTRKVLWMLVDRFFARVYVFFPFIDQFSFEEEIARILGSDSRADEKISRLHTKRKLDFVHLGILMVVLRFGYLSLFTNSDAINELNLKSTSESGPAADLKYLLNNPIHMDVIDLSNESLAHCGFLRYSNIHILQLCLYLKLYYMFAPENCDSPDDTNANGNTAMVVNTAVSLGLHREPEKLGLTARDGKTDHLCRKMWYFLLIVDVTESMSTGISPSTDKDMFDTYIPYYDPGNENVRDPEVEKEAVAILTSMERCYDPLHEVAKGVSKIRHQSSIITYRTLITKFETECLMPMNFSIPDKKKISPREIIEFKIYLQSRFLLVSTTFHFFNYYERLNEIEPAYYYFKKILGVVIGDMMPIFSDYVEKSLIWFEDSTDLAITPVLQNLVHKCFIILLAVLIRCRFSILGCETLHNHLQNLMYNSKYKTRFELLNELHSVTYQCFDIFVDTSARLSSRYYYSWRSVKTQEKLRSVRDGRDFYLDWCRGKETPFRFDSDVLQDIIGTIREALRKTQACNPPKEELRPNEDSQYYQEGLSPVPTVNYPYSVPDATVDDWWMLMLSVKPSLGNTSLYNNQSPALDVAFQNVGLGLNSDDFNMILDSANEAYPELSPAKI